MDLGCPKFCVPVWKVFYKVSIALQRAKNVLNQGKFKSTGESMREAVRER